MATSMQAPPQEGPGRAEIAPRTLRNDRWWVSPTITAGVLVAFIAYSTWAALQNSDYYIKPYLSPFYSPCIASVCGHVRDGALASGTYQHATNVGIIGTWWPITPAILVLIFPLGFRFTCYYYRRSYYRAFWQSPPACAVGERHKSYSGETRFPLVMQNLHRYFFYFGLGLNCILTYDAVLAFRNTDPTHTTWGHMGLGTLVLVVNAVLLWLYSLSCHSCRHIIGGRLKHFSKHPIRFKAWGFVSKLNRRHMQLAWASLVFVALTDLYVRLVASGTIHDPRFF
jgi:hypothetical protein